MNPDKKLLRKKLLDERMNLPERSLLNVALQRVLRAFLIGRTDTVIGAYWPIKAEFDALPALYRWQEDAALGAELDSNAQGERQKPSKPDFLDINPSKIHVEHAGTATEFIANILQNMQENLSNSDPLHQHRLLPSGPVDSPRKIGLPVIDRAHKTLQFHAWWPGCPMQNDAYDIPKPRDTEVLQPSLLLVPCLGYTDGGYRLGYGGGFYDRTLATLQPAPITVGLAFSHAYIADLEPEPHDMPLDAILTEEGIFWVNPSAM